MRRKTPEEFNKEFKELVGEEYTLLEPYYLSSIPIEIRHNICGHTYKARPNAFLKGGRCPYCNGNIAKHKTTNDFKKEVYDLVGNEYTVIGEYINNSTNIKIRHNRCGREYMVRPNNFSHGSRCIECRYQDMRCSIEQVQAYINDAIGDKYELVGKYKSMQIPTILLHRVCGHTFSVRVTDVINKHSACPFCSASTGEVYIRDWLEKNNLPYEYQKGFVGLRDVHPLTYDFFIPSKGILIEYQGEQHFKPTMFCYSMRDDVDSIFEKQKRHDAIKRKYAYDNGYKLLCPTYKLNTYTLVSEYLSKNCR